MFYPASLALRVQSDSPFMALFVPEILLPVAWRLHSPCSLSLNSQAKQFVSNFIPDVIKAPGQLLFKFAPTKKITLKETENKNIVMKGEINYRVDTETPCLKKGNFVTSRQELLTPIHVEELTRGVRSFEKSKSKLKLQLQHYRNI
uniref:Uncharacterized protein n=1 Tax=Timema poppense TaxID=170557 RepID=A0A7R9HDU8_TIMPO|nr:unnamed protein product [Timema poppensis]